MNKLTSLFVAAAVLALAGCASKGDVENNSIQLKTMEERITALDGRLQRVEQTREASRAEDATRYCFNNGQAYSEGSILAGRICQRQTGMVVYQGGKPVSYPLYWAPWKYQ
ncbi:TPA: hypothetical protein L5627_006001 [Pseudomonas aeruginosa]|nr:hypothetical protein [Pseudomonas aeruginosa]